MTTVDDPARTPPRTRRRAPGAGSVVAAVVVLVLLAVPTALADDGAKRWLDEHGLRHTPAGFVELSFPTPGDVGSFVQADGTTALVFQLSNRFAERQEIRWRVVNQPDDGRARVLARGETSIAAGTTWRRTVKTTVTCAKRGRIRVQVRPQGEPRQEISFLVHGSGQGDERVCNSVARK